MHSEEQLHARYLIIGNSAGGIGAVEAIREVDTEGTIFIVSDEPYPAYSRPMISEYLAGKTSIERMLYRASGFYAGCKVHAILGSKVHSIDSAAHVATLQDGRKIVWEKLLMATGGQPIIPSIRGSLEKGVFTFTTLDDARAIDNSLEEVSRIAVIGGGLIGVSVTEALVKRGKQVTIIEMKDRLLNTILDSETSRKVADVMTLAGVEIITDSTAVEITRDFNGKINGLTLANSVNIPCQMVILAIGVKPRVELAESAGIKVNRGILVNRKMETSRPDIYACGDAAEVHDFVSGTERVVPIWPNASIGGRIAGFNMAGVSRIYSGTTSMNTVKYFGLSIVSAGVTVPPDESYEILSSENNRNYRKIVLKDNVVVGMILTGDIESAGIILYLMQQRIPVTEFKDKLVVDNLELITLPERIWRNMIRTCTAA